MARFGEGKSFLKRKGSTYCSGGAAFFSRDLQEWRQRDCCRKKKIRFELVRRAPAICCDSELPRQQARRKSVACWTIRFPALDIGFMAWDKHYVRPQQARVMSIWPHRYEILCDGYGVRQEFMPKDRDRTRYAVLLPSYGNRCLFLYQNIVLHFTPL